MDRCRASRRGFDPHDRRSDDLGDVDKRIAEIERRLHSPDRNLRLGSDDGHGVGRATPPEGGRDSEPHESRGRSVKRHLDFGANRIMYRHFPHTSDGMFTRANPPTRDLLHNPGPCDPLSILHASWINPKAGRVAHGPE